MHHLGITFLQKVHKISPRQIQRWSSDPATSATNERNPVDRYETLLNKLMERGHYDIARLVVARQANIVGCTLDCMDDLPAPDKETTERECLDDYPAVTAYHDAMLTDQPLEIVMELKHQAFRELNETFARYKADKTNAR
jgi:hypothetical protein